MEAYDLIHNGYYLLGETEIVRFYALNGGFYTLDDKWVGRAFVDALGGGMEVFVAENEWKTITPIPLTPEILEKNGWVRRIDDMGDLYCELRDYKYDLYFFPEDNTINLRFNKNQVFSRDIKGVHELQGALYFCGLNDLADNFKV